MKTREWIFIIILVALGQMLLHYIAFDFAGSGRALGYISIAGTIVSIVLGMIAIIYSFVQSVTHSNSVADIRGQVEKLVEVGNGISNLEEGLQKSAKKINKATKGLFDQINENTNATKRVADNMESISQAFTKDGSSSVELGKDVGGVGYSSEWTILDVCHLMTGDCIRFNMDLAEFHMEMIEPYSKRTEWASEFISGVFTAVCMDMMGRKILKLIDAGDDSALRLEKLDGFDEYLEAVRKESVSSKTKEIVEYVDFASSVAGK